METTKIVIKYLNISEEAKQNSTRLNNLSVSLSDLTKDIINKNIDRI